MASFDSVLDDRRPNAITVKQSCPMQIAVEPLALFAGNSPLTPLELVNGYNEILIVKSSTTFTTSRTAVATSSNEYRSAS